MSYMCQKHGGECDCCMDCATPVVTECGLCGQLYAIEDYYYDILFGISLCPHCKKAIEEERNASQGIKQH